MRDQSKPIEAYYIKHHGEGFCLAKIESNFENVIVKLN